MAPLLVPARHWRDTRGMDYADALERSDKDCINEVSVPTGLAGRLSEFTKLKILRLTGNQDIEDFSFLAEVSTLEELHVDKMGLTEIPEVVTKLPGLTTLFIGNNPITDFTPLAKCANLIDLGIEGMDLKKIPGVVAKLKNLKVLGMSDNEITSLTALKGLKSLEALYAGNNRIKKLAKELAKLPLRKLHTPNNFPLTGYEVLKELKELEELTLTNSKETPNIPACVFELTKLKQLTLYLRWDEGNPCIEGIENIGALINLESLSIKGAAMTCLPEGIGKLTALRTLSLEKNESLKEIDALHDLPNLEELDLTSCPITELGDNISTLQALKTLNVSYNSKLKRVDGLRDLPNLQSLDLYCTAQSLPETLGTLTALTTLDLTAKAKDLSFLRMLTELEELTIRDCSFDTLPSELAKLKRLTIFRDEAADDSYLQAYSKLEELSVSQPSFALPLLPSLKSLDVSRLTAMPDLANLPALSNLEELSINRSDDLTELPPVLREAKQVKRATFEFFDNLTDLSAVGGMTALEELELRYLEKLKALPQEMAGLERLRKLDLGDLDAVKDVSVIGELAGLEWLRMASMDAVQTLPESMAKLGKLRYVRLRSNDELKDISVLEKVESLDELSVEYCDELRRKSIAAVEDAIAARQGGVAELKMSYQQFMDSGHYKTLAGKHDPKREYGFPLWFDSPEVLRDAIEPFSWLDDIRDDEDMPENAILTDPNSDLKPLAILDLGWEGCDTSHMDSHCEEIFLVDTASARNPVFIWGHDGSPEKLHDDFDEFLASLRPFVLESEEGEDDEGDEASAKRYFEYVDDKSSKFWQVVVTGSQHEVTYGKIGKDGSSKVKQFDSPEAAQKDADKAIASKVKKGYVEK